MAMSNRLLEKSTYRDYLDCGGTERIAALTQDDLYGEVAQTYGPPLQARAPRHIVSLA